MKKPGRGPDANSQTGKNVLDVLILALNQQMQKPDPRYNRMNGEPMIKSAADLVKLELLKGQLHLERQMRECGERIQRQVESWMDSCMAQVLPADIYQKSKRPELHYGELRNYLNREGFTFSVHDDGFTYVLKQGDKEISRMTFKRPKNE